MKYRKLDANGDPIYGQGDNSFVTDKEAVAQAILTRIKLFEGEWWENIKDGLPVWSQLLTYGGTGNNNRSSIITSRILGTKFGNTALVVSMNNVSVVYNSTTRKYTYTGSAQSIYGEIIITNGGS
jgi:hypothetical protein